MPPCRRPNASFVHSYGPPSCVNAAPTSAIRSMYGATKTTREDDEPEEALRAVRRDGAERVEPDERADREEHHVEPAQRLDQLALLLRARSVVVCSATAMRPPEVADAFQASVSTSPRIPTISSNSSCVAISGGEIWTTGSPRSSARQIKPSLEELRREEAAQQRLALLVARTSRASPCPSRARARRRSPSRAGRRRSAGRAAARACARKRVLVVAHVLDDPLALHDLEVLERDRARRRDGRRT